MISSSLAAAVFGSNPERLAGAVQGAWLQLKKLPDQLSLEAMDRGFPTHGGLKAFESFCDAFGREARVREVIAFRRTTRLSDPMTQAPSPVSVAQLLEN